MRGIATLTAIALSLTTYSAMANSHGGRDPITGARPGHEPGVGISLPMSNVASNITPNNTRSVIAPTLPTPAVADETDPSGFLQAARAALLGGQTGLAQQSLEMAETRALSRPVPMGFTGVPSEQPLVFTIREARLALGDGNQTAALQRIDAALAQ